MIQLQLINMSIVKAFNEHFEEFISDIERVFHEDTDIATAHNALITLKKNNPKLIMTTFRDWIARPYKKEIEKGDITFFLKKDYSKDFNDFGCGDTGGMILSKIDVLREPISKMKGDDLNKVITYMQNLTKLCELYV